MKKINFDNIILINEINKINTQYVKCISEHNSSDSQNYKCLNFKATYDRYNFAIRLFIQENDNNLTIELLCENICRNIDVSDDAMEFIINEIAIIAKLVKCKLEEYINTEAINKSIEIDSMIIDDNIEIKKFDLEEIKNKIQNLYNTLKPDKAEYSNYTNKLYLFTKRGYYIAKVLAELNIASFRRTRSGYEIKFLEEESRYTNSFNDKFARELSSIGIPSISVTNEYLDYSW
ncbi:hypothetical protein ACJDT4_23315 [Clostridium neuense]|uniref:Uncharacterized protein n=1 Tax=Clostridium neuense TaxID=1728934 RepID=A0ABW8TPB1_9CLOT